MVEAVSPRPPKVLKTRGRALWRDLMGRFEFDAQEADLLLEVCRTLDTIDALSASVARDGTMIVGSQGQQVLNPAVSELRQQQASYGRLVAQLNLGAAESGMSIATLTSVQAKAAANARWARSRDARGA